MKTERIYCQLIYKNRSAKTIFQAERKNETKWNLRLIGRHKKDVKQ